MKTAFLVSLLICSTIAKPQHHIEVLDSNTFILGEGVVLNKTSFRGLSVVDDNNIWVSGSRGTFARSTDGGKTFVYQQLKGYEKSDFRDIEAFDDKRAIIMSSGTPALILKTTDGGLNWKEVFRQNDSAYFLDAMDFWDEKRGMLIGDPIKGHFVLLETKDGGETWRELDSTKTPKAYDGEAVFAASGTSLRCLSKKSYGFVTGGSTSRFILKKRPSSKFYSTLIPIIQGKSSQGTFSFAKARMLWLYVGGDYLSDTQSVYLNFYYTDRIYDSSFYPMSQRENMNGYKSCVEVISDKAEYGNPCIISTGSSGTQVGCRTCAFVEVIYSYTTYPEPFHVVRKAKKGRAVFLAGPKGKIGKLVYSVNVNGKD